MMKKIALMLLMLCLALTFTSCRAASNQTYYETAQLYLGRKAYDDAASLFRQLGGYERSGDYVLYCEALSAIGEEEYAVARANFTAIAPFLDSEMYLQWLDARAAEESGDLAAALSMYEALGTFAASDARASALRTDIPEAAIREGRRLMADGQYAAARDLFLTLEGYGSSQALADNCTLALQRAAYAAAEALAGEADYLSAMGAFAALGDVMDAPKRAEQCRDALLASLEALYAEANLSTAAELTEAYAAIDDEAARTRIAELEARFGTNLAVLSQADAHPYVLLEDATLWRVDAAEGTVLTLSFAGMVEIAAPAEEEATPTDLPMTADLTPNGLSLRIDLAAFTFTAGSGTPADPFR